MKLHIVHLFHELNNFNTTLPELEGCTEAKVSIKYYYNKYYIYSNITREKEFVSILDTYDNHEKIFIG